MLMNQVATKHGVGPRNFTVSAATGRDARLWEIGQQSSIKAIEKTMSRYQSEASWLRQQVLKTIYSTDIQTKKLWEYMYITTMLEDLRNARDALEKLTANSREIQELVDKKLEESKVYCSKDVDDGNNDDVTEEDKGPEDEVVNTGSVDKDDDDRTEEMNQTLKALGAVKEGGSLLINALCGIKDWLEAHESNPQIPEEFRQMMKQQSRALENDFSGTTHRVMKEVADRSCRSRGHVVGHSLRVFVVVCCWTF